MKYITALLYWFVLAIQPATADDGILYPYGAKPDAYHLVNSKITERPYHIYIDLPDSYGEANKTYPVIYLLDGGLNFPMISPYYLLLRINEPMPEAIIVGIAYPGLGLENGNYRGTDYTAPSPERDYFGGAENYQRFLKTELLPLVETTYRADKSRRILFGQSLAGQFVLYSAMTNPDLFWGRIASNPALHRNLQFFLDLETTEPSKVPNVFIGRASREAERFSVPLKEWMARWESEAPPWAFEVQMLEGEYHAGAAPIAFRAGMRWLFSADTGTEE